MTNKELFAKHIGLGTFIETGTCFGRSVQQAIELGFKDIRSVEGSVERFRECQSLFRRERHVRLWCGESIEHLPMMMQAAQTPALFFLDAHPSGKESYGQDYETNPAHEQSAILRAELELIHKRNVKGDVILIDDLSEDIKAFARNKFPDAEINIYDTEEGPQKVMEIQT